MGQEKEAQTAFKKIEMDFAARCEELNILLKDWIDDIRSMDIVTATSDDLKVKIDPKKGDLLTDLPQNVKINARTTIQLDGDVIVILPTKQGTPGDPQIDNDILQIHKENVDFALKNLASNMKIITDGVVQALSLAKENGLWNNR